jgi:primosomal protein N'
VLFMHEVHKVRGRAEDEFEAAFRDGWMPTLGTGDEARLLWYANHAHGSGPAYTVVTVTAVRDGSREAFYGQELEFRAELGYPPFRRLCQISAHGKAAAGARALLDEVSDALRGISELTIYPAMALGRAGAATAARMRFVVKGPPDLPRRIGPALRPFLERGRRSHGMVEIEMDPLSI